MAEKIIECVPNFSEGRNQNVIKLITNEIEKVEGTKLLDVDPGFEMNRVVVTFIGNPDSVQEAAFNAIKKAAELIDMSVHHGSHPRMGATDVCPFVPVNGVSEEECIEISRKVAKRVGDELNIPVYLYEKSATDPKRQNLAAIRQGEYEALPEKLEKPEWKPDFGPAVFNPKAGATVIGVREFLIAYNVNLNTREAKFATDIAFELREKGRSARKGNIEPVYLWGEEILRYSQGHYPCGNCDYVGTTRGEIIDHCRSEHGYDLDELLKLHDVDPENPEGRPVKKPGKFKHCKSIGWMVPEYDRAQISINLTDYKVTSMHAVLEEARRLAEQRGIVVTGSEIVGMVPFNALLDSGKYYLKKQGRSIGVPARDILATAVQSLGLNNVAEFNIEERVLGLPKNPKDALAEMKVTQFVDEVSRESAAPGGGSIAALAGALGAALGSMVSNLTANKRGSQDIDDVLNAAAEKCQEIKNELVTAIDEDANAFNAFLEARRLPSQTQEEKKEREKAMQQGLKKAISVPMRTAELSAQAIETAKTVAEYGNPKSITDVGVGAEAAFAGVKGGIYNVLINLKGIKDSEFCQQIQERCAGLEKMSQEVLNSVRKIVHSKI